MMICWNSSNCSEISWKWEILLRKEPDGPKQDSGEGVPPTKWAPPPTLKKYFLLPEGYATILTWSYPNRCVCGREGGRWGPCQSYGPQKQKNRVFSNPKVHFSRSRSFLTNVEVRFFVSQPLHPQNRVCTSEWKSLNFGFRFSHVRVVGFSSYCKRN